MTKKAQKPEQEKPQEGKDDPIPLAALDKMDELSGKATGVDDEGRCNLHGDE